MSWVEIVLFSLSVIYLILAIIGHKRLKAITSLLSLAAFGIFIGHLLFDIPNWQLYPLYFFIVMSTTVTFIDMVMLKSGREPNESKKKITIIGLISILIAGILMMIFPVYEIPKPDGAFSVGTVTFDLIDGKRVEQYGANAETTDTLRRIKVQVWYPSDDVSDYKQAPWLQDGILLPRSLAKEMKMPFFVLDYTKDILSNAYIEAPVSQSKERYPVVIISHGWTGFRNLHNDFAELLASNGFIVLGINHTYGAQMTVFEDGFSAELDKNALPDRAKTPDFLKYANQLVLTYADDVKLVLETMDTINEGRYSNVLTGVLDVKRIGLMGHSTGGGADVSVALSDSRIKSLFCMDAWVEPLGKETLSKGVTIPAVFLRSEQWQGGINDNYLMPLVKASDNAKLFQINGTTHLDFTMSTMFSSLTGIIGYTGKLDRALSARIQHEFALEFFNDTLISAPNADQSFFGNLEQIANEFNSIVDVVETN
ncbi:alpha/beta hydrolase [Fusibacter bizertensis]